MVDEEFHKLESNLHQQGHNGHRRAELARALHTQTQDAETRPLARGSDHLLQAFMINSKLVND